MGKRDDQLDAEEAAFTRLVAEALTGTADEFADAVADATELVAARFSVSRIARMWGNRTRGLVRRLLGTAETAAQAAAEDVGTELPEGWDDLPGRYDDGTLPEGLGQYVETTEHLLRAVGDRLADVAREELAAGVDAGEDIDQLKARLRTAFSREGAQLGVGRENLIGQTEAGRAWNTSTLAAARAVTGPDRPVVKQWLTRGDTRVRSDHQAVDGQLRLLAEPFRVGGVDMQTPGDPTAPAAQVCNCRCRLAVAPEVQAAAFNPKDSRRVHVLESEEHPMHAFHGTQGRPSYRKYHPSGTKTGKTRHANGGWLGSDRFTEEEHQQAVYRYTRSWYEPMNGWLRTRKRADNAESQRTVEQRVAALNDLIGVQEPSSSEVTLYRRMENHRLELNEGDEFHDRGFLSTSSRGDIGGIAGMDADDPDYTFFTITVPAGAQMLDVAAVGEDDDEAEVILPPGTKFRVRRVMGDDPSQPRRYEVDVINAVSATAFDGPAMASTSVKAAAGDTAFQDRITWQPEDIVVDRRASAAVTASAEGHTGAMIALIPTEADQQRLVLDGIGAEVADELHLTLFFLGDGADWDEEQRGDLIASVRAQVSQLGQNIGARAFGSNHWNANGAEPAWVWSVGDDPERGGPTLESARYAATWALENMHSQPDLPLQHTPWAGHVTAAYSADAWPLPEMNARLGPITFDRVRIAFAGVRTDIPLQPEPEEEAAMADEEAVTTGPLAARPWWTPDDTALIFEDEETGDGRVFRAGSVYWSGDGPWPLQYADEMLLGHQGAELAGSIQTVGRDGHRVTGTGLLYPSRPAGYDAIVLLEDKAPLGVSADLDDVSVEFVDRTPPSEDGEGDGEGEVILLASLPSASMLRLQDGSWMLTATAAAGWTASGADLTRSQEAVQIITGPGGRVSAATVVDALGALGVVTASAGDRADDGDGTVVHSEKSGDLLMRVTRARLRGATLVAMPAYDQARIVLDTRSDSPEGGFEDEEWASAAPSDAQRRVVEYVRTSPAPVDAPEVARRLRMRVDTARNHLIKAAKAGLLVRLAPGLYVGPTTDLSTPTAEEEVEVEEETASMRTLVASAWTAMQDLPPMPADWFREPTAEELPPGSGGVHCSGGRIWGWVAQAGVPHAGYPGKKLTIESLGRLDTSHFLRARFELDDGTTVKAGAFTMDVPHRRDGAECEDASCQFDDSRTVAGIVTVGQNAGGLWFAGAAGPWLADWDRTVFKGCQPSYHMTKAGSRWQLRAVLSVPVPGHSSPLLATAVAERSNLALAASAARAATTPDMSGQRPDTAPNSPDNIPDMVTVTAAELRGHRPDSVRTTPGHGTPGADIAAGLLENDSFIDVLLQAMDRRQEQRDANRAELAALTASVIEPAREEIAAATTEGAS